MTFRLKSLSTALGVGFALLLPATSFGTPVTGTLNITGSATVSATILSFFCDTLQVGSCPSGYGGERLPGTGQTGTFATITPGSPYFISTIATPSAGGPALVGRSFMLPNFITFQAAPDIFLDLTFISTGVFSACTASGNVNCTPDGIPQLVNPTNLTGKSAFNLSNTANGSSASFAVSGVTRRASTNETAPFNGVFTAQFVSTPGTNDANVDAILFQLATAGSISNSFSATFVATVVPEPATTSLLIGGLLIFAGAGFRRFRK